MQIITFLCFIASVSSFSPVAVAKTSLVGLAVVQKPTHLSSAHMPLEMFPQTSGRQIRTLAMAHPDIHDYASAVAHNLHSRLPDRVFKKPALISEPVAKVVEAVENAPVKAITRIRGGARVPFKASLERPAINFDQVIFDEATQTYTIPAKLMEPYKEAILGARAKVKEDEAARFIRENPIVGNILGQGVVEGGFTVGLQVMCVLLNSPFKPLSNFAINTLAKAINSNPTPEIAEKFFRGQCNHAGIEHTLWIRKMKGKFGFKI